MILQYLRTLVRILIMQYNNIDVRSYKTEETNQKLIKHTCITIVVSKCMAWENGQHKSDLIFGKT